MGMMFAGAPTAAPQGPSLDQLLAGFGINGSPAAGQTDPSAVLASLGIKAPPALGAAPATGPAPGLSQPPATAPMAAPGPSPTGPADLSSMVSGILGGGDPASAVASPAPAAAPTSPPAAASSALPDLPKPGFWDKLLYGVDAQPHVLKRYGDELGAIQAKVGLQHSLDQYQALQGTISALPDGSEKAAAQADPQGYAKTLLDRVSGHTLKEGETYDLGNGQQRYAPRYGLDASGHTPYVQAGTSTTIGPRLPGSISAKDGVFVDDTKGGVGAYSLPQVVAPGSSPGAFTPSFGGAASAPGTAGAAAVAAGASGGAGLGAASAAQAAIPAGPDAATLSIIQKLENRKGDPFAKNGSSTGTFQFQPRTFYGLLPHGDINSPVDQAQAAQLLLNQNRAALQKAGLPPSTENLQLLHQQGAAGGIALLTHPNDNAVQTLVNGGFYKSAGQAQRAIVGNYGTADMSAAKFVGVQAGKVQREQRRAARGGVSPAAAAPAATPAAGIGWSIGAPVSSVTQLPDGTEQHPDGSLTPGPGYYGPAQKQALYERVAGSDDYKQAKSAMAAYQAMTSNAQTMTGPSAYSILDTFARAINPGAVARPQVIETIEKNLGPLNHVAGGWAGLQGQGNLTPAVRQQVIDAVHPFVTAHWSAANELNEANRQTALRNKFDPADVVAPLGGAPKRYVIGDGQAGPKGGPPRLTPEQASKLPSGTRFMTTDGRWLTRH